MNRLDWFNIGFATIALVILIGLLAMRVAQWAGPIVMRLGG